MTIISYLSDVLHHFYLFDRQVLPRCLRRVFLRCRRRVVLRGIRLLVDLFLLVGCLYLFVVVGFLVRNFRLLPPDTANRIASNVIDVSACTVVIK